MPENHLKKLLKRYPVLESLQKDMQNVYELLRESYQKGGKLLVCGNGGSAADADHIVGELMKGFYLTRPLTKEYKEKLGDLGEALQGSLPAISLNAHSALSTAFINDVEPVNVFAQQVLGYGKPGDIFLGLSTSGNSQNVYHGAKAAKALGLKVIGLTGEQGGLLRAAADVCICAPSAVTAEIQEYHLPIYHTICAMLEDYFFK